jgi:peroxiredoxin family protein
MANKKMAIIATKGTLDMAYPPFILASTAAALGYDVQVFFTFYGLQLLRKDLSHVMISPLANPAMPMPIPMPVMVQMLPGMESMATMMMKQKIKKHGVATLEELRDLCLEADVKFIACQMTVDLFEFDKSEFIEQCEYGGAATFLGFAGDTDICLFI